MAFLTEEQEHVAGGTADTVIMQRLGPKVEVRLLGATSKTRTPVIFSREHPVEV